MKSSWWMILLGFMLLLAGLANTLFDIRQIPTSFDIAEGVSVDVPTLQPVEITPTIPNFDIWNPNSGLQPASLINEPNHPIVGVIPDRLVIPSISLDAPIVPTKVKKVDFEGQTYYQWIAPNQLAVGWHDSSALLGLPGNTVLNGHHNVYGKVFKDLVKLHEGDLINVYSGDQVFKYRVALAMLLPERFKTLTVRLENARWILPTDDERLTLITCWPADSNTHRVVIVALPEK
jgi:LPXTG-site transpeptidase (sortase) family protein